MTIIDTYPNVERTITSIEASLISKREYERLKAISRYVYSYINIEIEQGFKNYDSIKFLLEQFIRNSEYKNSISKIEKEIIIGNILLSNDLEIAELLNKHGFTIEHLKVIIRFRSLLKNVILNSVPIDEELERQFKIYKKYISKIIEIFKSEYALDDQTVILNRITEILVTNHNYFESKYSEHTKKR